VELQQLLQALNHAPTALCAQAERLVSQRLEGSCQMPLAVFARLEAESLVIDALVGTVDGKQVIRSSRCGAPGRGAELAQSVAEDLLDQGADRIIAGLGKP
jgi:hydroxymethylbilane synthase